MKQAAEYAKKVNRLFNTLKKQHGKVEPPTEMNPLEQLILAILARNTSDTKAHAAYHRLRENMVDNNELRVTPPGELADVLGDDLPDTVAKARVLLDALNGVYDRQNAMDLSFLKGMSVRDARDCLRSLSGVDEFAAARVVLLSLGGHAIPIDDHTASVLRREELVSPEATIEEIQAFLERHIHAADTLTFSMLLHRYAATKAPRTVTPMPPIRVDKSKIMAEVTEKPRVVVVAAKKGKEGNARAASTSAHKVPAVSHARPDKEKKAPPAVKPAPKAKPARKS